MRISFKLRVYQHGRLSQEQWITQDFEDAVDLAVTCQLRIGEFRCATQVRSEGRLRSGSQPQASSLVRGGGAAHLDRDRSGQGGGCAVLSQLTKRSTDRESNQRASFPVVAWCWCEDEMGFRSPGEVVVIQPNDTHEVNGPYVGEMEGKACFLYVPGSIVCHEGPDDGRAWHIDEDGDKLNLGAGNKGVTIRRHQGR